MIEEGELKEEFTKRKRDERKKTWHTAKLQGQFVVGTKDIADELSGKWIKNGFLKKDRGHDICSTETGTKDQYNQSKDRQTTSVTKM